MQAENGWVEYKRLVLQQLETLTAEVKELRKDLTEAVRSLREDVWKLKVKAAGWGGVAALLVTVVLKFVFKL
jgi:hypothetical protein